MTDARRALPSVEQLLVELRRDNGPSGLPLPALTEAARAVLAKARAGAENSPAPDAPTLAAEAKALAEAQSAPSLRPVINASGVILQTNLGRAPLSQRAIAAMTAVAQGYSNVEFDLAEGTRGSRHEHVRHLIRRTTGAEDGLVVNNNAAALFMVLHVFAQGREVIVSRGQAVEIGGGFRIPDVLNQSGALLKEVGTTNRTYARDYDAAWSEQTAAILRVHSSNFKVVGFAAEAALADLAAIAHARGGLLIDDLGSGCLVDTAAYGIAHEPTVQESLAAGADLALFSGDKLLGGPQCGVIAGRQALIEELRRHPLARALRVDKLTIAALNATLLAYAHGIAASEIPVWRMLGADLDDLEQRASQWAAAAGHAGTVVPAETMVGGGSLPGEGVPSWCCAIRVQQPDPIAAALRNGDVALVGRVEGGALLLDARTVDPADDARVIAAIQRNISTL